jgi:IS30 family transposase
MAKNKHLTDEERLQIESWLKGGFSLKKIAEWLGKSKSTISREIRAHALPSDKSAPYRPPNRCALRRECKKLQLCYGKPNCTKRCSTCKLCNTLCDDFIEEVCYRLSSSPYVCNGCEEDRHCTLRRRYYFHKKAHEAYREMLSESRSGINMTENELRDLDDFVSPLIRKGQSIHHIVSNNSDQFNISEKTIYRYVDSGLLAARNIDMPRVVRLRPRKAKPVEHKVDKQCRNGRTYPEFLQFVQNTDLTVVEMDSVLGRAGGKILLTLAFENCDFMLAFLRDRNTSQSVIDHFNWLYEILGPVCFKALFPVLLGDNGSEFSNPKALEFDLQGNRRTNVFYCDPYSSFQKPKVEWSHTLLRRILPKGFSFDHLNQDDINLVISHVNSYSRESLNDKSPIDLFALLYGRDTYEKMGLRKIPSNEIVLMPSLLKKDKGGDNIDKGCQQCQNEMERETLYTGQSLR